MLCVLTAAVSATRKNAQSLVIGKEEKGLGMYDGTTTTIEKHPYLVRK